MSQKLNYGRTCCIGLAFMGISAFWQLYDNIVPLILKNTFVLEETITGVIMAADNILAVVLLPFLGAWSDRVDTRFGKRTPFIVFGTLLSVLFMMLVPMADRRENLPLFILSLGAVLISMGLYRSPAVALMPDLTPPALRSQGNAVINVMGALGAIFSLGMIQILVEETSKPDYTRLFLSVAAVMLVSLVVLLVAIQEKKMAKRIAEEYPDFHCDEVVKTHEKMSAPVRKSLAFGLAVVFFYYVAYNGVTTAFSRYAQEVWGLEGGGFAVALLVVAVSAFVSYIPLGVLATRIGRKKVIGIGFAMMVTTFVGVSFVSEYHPYVNMWFVLVGIGGSAVGVNIFPVIVDMCHKSELGKYTGLYYTFSMAAQIVTPIASGFLLEHVSYRTLFPYAAAFSALGLVMLTFVRHGDAKPEHTGNLLEFLDQ